jgi:hypothetical protein
MAAKNGGGRHKSEEKRVEGKMVFVPASGVGEAGTFYYALGSGAAGNFLGSFTSRPKAR